MKIGIVAGESSGDFLGAELIRALQQRFPGSGFHGISGPRMQAEGATTIAAMESLSVMGLEGILGSIGEILAIRRELLRQYRADPPDLFIGIDAPDFNLGVEQKLRKSGIPTVHYVSPTVWAWRGHRIDKIRRAVDLMLTLFPFEADYYRERNVPVTFVGHPLAETLIPGKGDPDFRERYCGDTKRLIAVLPGSRRSEIKRLGRVFVEACIELNQRYPDLSFAIPFASAAVREAFDTACDGLDTEFIQRVDGDSQRVLAASDLALLASGTAALEAGLLAVPMVVAYRISSLGYWYVRRTLSVDYASMPNHLLDTHPVPEFIHDRVTAPNLVSALATYLDDPALCRQVSVELAAIHGQLHRDSGALAADAIAGLLQ